MALTTEQLALGCPNRVKQRHRFHCKALIGQPNGTLCSPDNCAAIHMADLMVNELRAEIYDMLGGGNENAGGTEAVAGQHKG